MPDEIDDAVTAATEEAGGVPVPDEVAAAPEEPVAETVEEAPVEEATAEAEPEAEPEAEAEPEEVEGEEDEEPLGLSAEQLKAVNDNPELLAIYKSMQRGLTKKSTTFAEERKALEESKTLVEYMRSDPDKALREFAEARGYTLAQAATPEAETQANATDAATDAISALTEKYSKEIGPESTAKLMPMIREIAELTARNLVQPIQQTTQSLEMSAKQRGIAASVAEFGAEVTQKGGTWDDNVMAEMSKVMDEIQPGANTGMREYLGHVHSIVTARSDQMKATKRELARLRTAKSTAEPVRSVRPAPKSNQSITSDMTERDAIALATAMAEKEYNANQ